MKSTEAKKLDVRVQKTYEKLYNAFFELLASKPYDSITVLEICDMTGIHRATFYKHFVDKQDFVNFIIEKKLNDLDFNGKETIFEVESKKYYIDMCENLILFIYNNKQLFSDLNIKTASSAFAQALENAIADYIERRFLYAQSRGITLKEPIPLLSHYYAGALVSLLKAWVSNWDKFSKEDILKFVAHRYNELDYSYKNNNGFASL